MRAIFWLAFSHVCAWDHLHFWRYFLINRLRDTPQSLGLPQIEQYHEDFSGSANHHQEKTELSVKEILWNYVLCNQYIWILSISYLFIYIVRTAINDWSMLYLTEVKEYSLITAGSCVIWFEVGGFLEIWLPAGLLIKYFKVNATQSMFFLLQEYLPLCCCLR